MVDSATQAKATAIDSAPQSGAATIKDMDIGQISLSTSVIEHVEVSLEAVLGACSVKIAELGKMQAGEVLELDRQINEAVDIRVNGKIIGRGEIVTVDDKFAVRITDMG